jgi:toxin CptA
MIAMVILENGFGAFFSELITLVVTFAGETGQVIVKAEIHELAFCLGAYLVYMLFKLKKNIVFWILLGLAAFCFVAAFKRIAILAIVVAVLLGWGLTFISKRNDKLAFRLTQVLTIVIMVILIGYIAIIKMDLFSMLQDAGLETSGRDRIYGAVDRFYEFSPSFMGHGIGFLTYQLNTGVGAGVGVTAVHNDFLQHFIDLGFWGYIIWLASMTLFRVNYFGKKGKTENAIVAFILIVYLVIVSSTDNTMNYPLLTTVLAVLMTGHGYDDRVRETETKMFGYISDANKKVESRSIL